MSRISIEHNKIDKTTRIFIDSEEQHRVLQFGVLGEPLTPVRFAIVQHLDANSPDETTRRFEVTELTIITTE